MIDIPKDFLSGGALAIPQGVEVIPPLDEYIQAVVAAALPIAEGLGRPQRLEIATALRQSRKQLQARFTEEEAGGVMEEAVVRIRRLADDAEMIQQEHPELLRQLDETTHLVQSARPTDDDRNQARWAIDVLVVRMLRHETAENRLLQRGFNEDLGALHDLVPDPEV